MFQHNHSAALTSSSNNVPERYAKRRGTAVAKLNMRVRGLENFRLTEASFRRLGTRNVCATVHLRTLELTFEVRRLQPSQRHSYLAMRVHRWIKRLGLRYPRITFQVKGDESTGGPANSWSLPQSLEVCCSAREILNVAAETAVESVYVTRVAGHRRRRPPASQLTWYCVRALVVIALNGRRRGCRPQRIVSFWFVLLRSKTPRNA